MLRNKQEKVVRRYFARRAGVVSQIGDGGSNELDEAVLNIQKSEQTGKNWLNCIGLKFLGDLMGCLGGAGGLVGRAMGCGSARRAL